MPLRKADTEPGFLRVRILALLAIVRILDGQSLPLQFTSVYSVYQKLRTVRTGPRMLWEGWIWYNISGFEFFPKTFFQPRKTDR
jgi:hypothetical protein